jgi:hypothetical protein
LEELQITEHTTLFPPDSDGDIEINIDAPHQMAVEFVSFSALEKWVASIREQIITSSNEQAKCFEGNCPENIYIECVNPKSKPCYKPPVG